MTDKRKKPSFEDGEIRDPAIAEQQDEGFSISGLKKAIKKVTQTQSPCSGGRKNS